LVISELPLNWIRLALHTLYKAIIMPAFLNPQNQQIIRG